MTAKQWWCYGEYAWRLIDDPLHDDQTWDSIGELYTKNGYELLLSHGDDTGNATCISLWVRDAVPQCLINIYAGGRSDAIRTLYTDALPDGLDLVARWAPAIKAAAGEGRQ